jgi:hypothetical protein
MTVQLLCSERGLNVSVQHMLGQRLCQLCFFALAALTIGSACAWRVCCAVAVLCILLQRWHHEQLWPYGHTT